MWAEQVMFSGGYRQATPGCNKLRLSWKRYHFSNVYSTDFNEQITIIKRSKLNFPSSTSSLTQKIMLKFLGFSSQKSFPNQTSVMEFFAKNRLLFPQKLHHRCFTCFSILHHWSFHTLLKYKKSSAFLFLCGMIWVNMPLLLNRKF